MQWALQIAVYLARPLLAEAVLKVFPFLVLTIMRVTYIMNVQDNTAVEYKKEDVHYDGRYDSPNPGSENYAQ